jgi:hypothetical protein
VLEKPNKNVYGGTDGPQDTYNSVTVNLIKAQICELPGHLLKCNYVDWQYFRIHRLQDVGGRAARWGPSVPWYAFQGSMATFLLHCTHMDPRTWSKFARSNRTEILYGFGVLRSWGSSVNIRYKYRLDDRASIPGGGKRIFPLASVSRTALRPTQPPVQWVPGSFPVGKARPGSDADHSPLISAEVKNE